MPLILPNDLANDILADGEKLQQNFTTLEDWGNQEVVTRDGSTAMIGALLLPGMPTQPNQAASKAYVDAIGLIGEIKMYGGDTEPPNWMFCRGQAISRATYAALFAVFGTKFGTGDNSTTFNLPDYRGQYPIGFNQGGAYFSAGVGERFGNKDAIVVAHDHDMANHVHDVHLNSNEDSVDHNHGPGFGDAGFVTNTGGAAPSFAPGPSTNFTVRGATGGASARHIHGVNGTTWGPSAPRTGSAGASGGNANLPPSVSINFLVKVQ